MCFVTCGLIIETAIVTCFCCQCKADENNNLSMAFLLSFWEFCNLRQEKVCLEKEIQFLSCAATTPRLYLKTSWREHLFRLMSGSLLTVILFLFFNFRALILRCFLWMNLARHGF